MQIRSLRNNHPKSVQEARKQAESRAVSETYLLYFLNSAFDLPQIAREQTNTVKQLLKDKGSALLKHAVHRVQGQDLNADVAETKHSLALALLKR